ncbi:MAG: hypothetical protein ACON4Z_08600 [Planctomycetota bacterium]
MTQYPNDSLESVEAQLVSLYGEREHLEAELGVSEAGAIVAMVRSLESQLGDVYGQREAAGGDEQGASADPSLELQLVDLYGQREQMQRELGAADADDVVSMVQSLEGQLRDVYRERELEERAAARVAAQIQNITGELQGSYQGSKVTYTATPDGSNWAVTWKTT